MLTDCKVGAGCSGAPLPLPMPWLLTLGLSVAWRRKVGGPPASIENELFACKSRREREGTGGASSKVGLKSGRFSADLACLANGKVDIEGFLRDWPWG